MDLYQKVKAAAQMRNISIEEVCGKVGYTRAGLSAALVNETLPISKFMIISETLGLSAEQLLYGNIYPDAGLISIVSESEPASIATRIKRIENELNIIKKQL